MFIQLKTFQVKKGSAVEMIERFSGKGIIEQQPGFLDLSVLHKKRTKEREEVLVLIRWIRNKTGKRGKRVRYTLPVTRKKGATRSLLHS